MRLNTVGLFCADAMWTRQKSSPWLAGDWQEPAVLEDLMTGLSRIATKRKLPQHDQRSLVTGRLELFGFPGLC